MTRITIKVDAVADAYGPEEAAKLLGKGEATIWRWIRDEKILVVRIGGRTLIPRAGNRKITKRARPTRLGKWVGFLFDCWEAGQGPPAYAQIKD